MQKPILFVSLALFFSCGNSWESTVSIPAEEQENKNVLEGLTYSIDTVMVAMGDQLVNFGVPLISSTSPDTRHFYILDYKSLQVKKIDLGQLTLSDTFFFEKDGPDSPGFTFNIQALEGDRFFFPAMGRPNIINKSGKKIQSWDLNLEKIVDGIPVEAASVTNRMWYDEASDQLYSLPLNYSSRDYFLSVLNAEGGSKTMVELVEFQEANKFTIRNGRGEGGGLKIEWPYLQQFNREVIISCTVGNAIYIYDPDIDSLSYREFPHEVVPPKKTTEIRNEVYGNAEFEAEIAKLNTQISYWNFLWDEQSQRYFRFASRALSVPMKGNEAKMELFLIAYSKDLQLIGETKLSGLDKIPFGSFFKDGKLYSYVNVEDELGFAVFTFDF